MEGKVIISIGREYGSGGREIGEKLAARLGIPCYDKLLLKETAKKSGLPEQLFEEADEQPLGLYLAGLGGNPAADINSPNFFDFEYLTDEKLFMLQSRTMRDLAAKGSCIFIGRCADYVLQDDESLVSIFIHGDRDVRVQRIMMRRGVGKQEAESLLKKTDRNRAHYHNFFSEKKWGASDSYDLSISSTAFGIDGVVDLLTDFFEKWGGRA